MDSYTFAEIFPGNKRAYAYFWVREGRSPDQKNEWV